MSEDLKLVLDELGATRREHREDLGRLHDRIDAGLTETARAAAETAAFQATTNVRLTGIERRFDIQNGRLAAAEAALDSVRAAMNVREGEQALKRRLLGRIIAVVRGLRDDAPWLVATVATLMGVFALWRG